MNCFIDEGRVRAETDEIVGSAWCHADGADYTCCLRLARVLSRKHTPHVGRVTAASDPLMVASARTMAPTVFIMISVKSEFQGATRKE